MVLNHFKTSTHDTGQLKKARKELNISFGLHSVGKTRFATVYYSGHSIYVNIPALHHAYSNNLFGDLCDVRRMICQRRSH